MARQAPGQCRVSLQALTISNAIEITALIAILERKGFVTHKELLEEIGRQMKARSGGR